MDARWHEPANVLCDEIRHATTRHQLHSLRMIKLVRGLQNVDPAQLIPIIETVGELTCCMKSIEAALARFRGLNNG